MDEIEVLDRAEISGSNVIVEYSKTEAALADLRAKYSGVVFDLKTTKGDKEARAARLELVTLRTGLEKKREEFKAPALAFGNKIDAEAKRVKAEIVKLEDFIDQQIKADEKRRADEKAEKDRVEALRVQALQDKIATIRGFVAKCQGISSERIVKGIELVSKIDTGADVFFEFQAQAVAAQVETMQAMRDMHAAAVASEAEAARVEAQRLENERIAEQNRIQAEAMAAQQAELDRAADGIKAEQARLEAERTRIAEEERKKAEAAAQARADAEIEAAAAQAEATRQAEQKAAQLAADAQAVIDKAKMPGLVSVRLIEPTLFSSVTAPVLSEKVIADQNANAFIDQIEAKQTPPTLKLGVIQSRLSPVSIDAAGLVKLGFHPTQVGASKLYQESDFDRICTALILHITEVRQGVAA